MTGSWLKVRRTLIVLALGGSTFGFSAFGIDGFGCNYALNRDYENLFQAMGEATIQTVSDNVFGNIGTDFDNVVRAPATSFAQALWDNWVTKYVPNDVEIR